ncbi:hypothetical protein MJ561_20535 [Klebsiella pneumoniae]|nr:hypothetical protein MJ561_20535 [Klebsiella pneumoniae]
MTATRRRSALAWTSEVLELKYEPAGAVDEVPQAELKAAERRQAGGGYRADKRSDKNAAACGLPFFLTHLRCSP